MEQKKSPEHCKGSPCIRCTKHRKRSSCCTVVEGRQVCGCTRWYCWAVRMWTNIHTQGLHAIEAKKQRQKAERAAGFQ